jgi:hypothetical protein
MRLNANLSPEAMRKRVRRAARFEQTRAYEVAFYLARIDERRDWTQYGHANVYDFARVELGLSVRQVRDRIRLARALQGLPRTRKAFMRGKLTFSAVRELTRVVTPATEAEWIRAAATHSMRELERIVASSEGGRVPRRPRLGLARNLVESPRRPSRSRRSPSRRASGMPLAPGSPTTGRPRRPRRPNWPPRSVISRRAPRSESCRWRATATGAPAPVIASTRTWTPTTYAGGATVAARHPTT